MSRTNKNKKVSKCNLEEFKCKWKMFFKITNKVNFR